MYVYIERETEIHVITINEKVTTNVKEKEEGNGGFEGRNGKEKCNYAIISKVLKM